MKKETIGERGLNLAIGVATPIGRVRDLAFRQWTTDVELDIGKALNRTGGKNVFAAAVEVLARLVTRWGSYDFDGMSLEERKMRLLQSFAPDILHAWVLLRYDAIGSKTVQELECGCGHTFKAELDIGTFDVSVLEDDDYLHYEVDLEDGIYIPSKDGGRVEKTIVCRPLITEHFATFSRRELIGLVVHAALGSVAGVGLSDEDSVQEPIRFGPDLSAYKLTKRDIDMISAAADDNVLGPVMDTEIECPECGAELEASVEWATYAFFSRPRSSQSRRRKKRGGK